MSEITTEQAIERFGFDPETAGNRPRGWYIVGDIGDEEKIGNAEIGFLCVRTRDGGSNPISMETIRRPNCVGTSEDLFDTTYRNYYFRPLPNSTSTAVASSASPAAAPPLAGGAKTE